MTALVGLVMLVGLAGVVVPLLPGTALVLAAGVAWAALVVDGGTARWVVVAVMGALFVAGAVTKYALPGKRLAGRLPKRTLLLGAVGAVVGLVLLPPLGLLIGGVAGVFAAELQRARRRPDRLARHGAGAAGGRPRRARRARRRRAHGRHLAGGRPRRLRNRTVRLPVEPVVQVEIWSDVVCPWCYVGKRRFEAALAAFPHRDEVQVRWRSFELDPSAPAERTGDYAAHLAQKYRRSRDEAQGMLDSMTATAAGEGLDFRFDRARPGSTFAAHQLLHLAHERGVQDALEERLFRAVFTEGEPVGDPEALVRLGVEAGLDEAEARAALADGRYADAVRADEQDAQRLGISGVPFFVVERRYGVSGAQPAEAVLQVLERAWSDAHPAPLVTVGGDAPGCDGDTCAV